MLKERSPTIYCFQAHQAILLDKVQLVFRITQKNPQTVEDRQWTWFTRTKREGNTSDISPAPLCSISSVTSNVSAQFTYETRNFFFSINRKIYEEEDERSLSLMEYSFVSHTFRNCLCSAWEENLALVPNFDLQTIVKANRLGAIVSNLLEIFQCFVLESLIVRFITPFEIAENFAQKISIGRTTKVISDPFGSLLVLTLVLLVRSSPWVSHPQLSITRPPRNSRASLSAVKRSEMNHLLSRADRCSSKLLRTSICKNNKTTTDAISRTAVEEI